MLIIDIYKLLISVVRYFLAVTFLKSTFRIHIPPFSIRSNILTKIIYPHIGELFAYQKVLTRFLKQGGLQLPGRHNCFSPYSVPETEGMKLANYSNDVIPRKFLQR